MKSFKFIQIHFTIKGFKLATSDLILKIGHGVTFVIALIGSLIFGYFTFSLYKVPVKDIQIYVRKVVGAEVADSFELAINMDYGLEITQKYKKDFSPGVELWIYESDNWRHNKELKQFITPYLKNSATGVTIDYNFPEIVRKLEDERIKYGYDSFLDSLMSLYQINMVESYHPQTFIKSYSSPLDTFTMYNSKVSKVIGKHVLKESKDKLSAIYHISENKTDTITGLESYCSKSLLVLSDSGLNRAVFIPSTELLVKPSKFSDFDISQGYFKFTIDLPSKGENTTLDFGGATEFSHIYPEPDYISMSAISYKTPYKVQYIKYRGLWFHAKFKQMENVQILRMFFVTTLFGFFIALMCSSFFKGIKVLSRRYKIKINKDTTK